MKTLVASAAIAALVLPGVAQSKPPKPPLIAVVDHTEEGCEDLSAGAQQAVPEALLSLVLGKVVNAGVKGIGKAMTKAGSDKEVHIKGFKTSYFYTATLGDEPQLEQKSSCLRVVAGVKGGSGLPVGPPKPGENAALGDPWGWVKAAGFDRAPHLYMETRTEISVDRTAFRLVPVKAFVGKAIQDDNSKERDLVVTFSITTPSADGDGDVLMTRSFSLKRPAEGPMDKTMLEAMASDWIPLPTPTEQAKSRFDVAVQRKKDIADLKKVLAELNAPPKPPKPGAKPVTPAEEPPKKEEVQKRLDDLMKAAETDPKALESLMPVTVRVDVHETKDGNKLLAAIGGFLTDNADKISEPIVNELDPAARKAAAKTAATEEQALRIAVIEAVEAWQTTEANADATAGQKRVKKLQAEGACRALRDAKLDDVSCLGL
jgi:hypothetical protein